MGCIYEGYFIGVTWGNNSRNYDGDTEGYLLMFCSWFIVSGLWSVCLVLVNVKLGRNLTVLTWDVRVVSKVNECPGLCYCFQNLYRPGKYLLHKKTSTAAVHLQHPVQSLHGSVFVSMNWEHALWPTGQWFLKISNNLFWKQKRRLNATANNEKWIFLNAGWEVL